MVALATLAVAVMTIGIKESQVPVTASAFSEHSDCAFPESPDLSPPMWGWHFVLPGGEATFVSLTATFETAGDITIPGPNGAFVQDGKGAVVYTPTDDTLKNATASIEGTTPQGYFVLSHTCLPNGSSATPTPSASASASASETPSASVSATATSTPSSSASETATATPSSEVSGTAFTSSPASSPASGSISPSVLGVKQTRGGVGGVGLPTTGSPVAPLIALGTLLVAAGVALASRPRGRYAR